MLHKMKFRFAFLATITAMPLVACNDNIGDQQDDTKAHPAVSTENSTLDKIKSSGTIVLGYRDSSIPFSYITDKPGKPVGYAHDLQLKVVEAVKQKLNLPDLNVRYNLVTSQNRIPLISNGTVDLECGSTTNNKERQRLVDFSVGFFKVGARLLTAKDSGINDFTDLKGTKLVTTAGTTSERYIKEHQKELGIAEIISSKDHAESFMMLQNGRAATFMMDDVLLTGEHSKAKNPDDWHIVGAAPINEIYGCMLRKGDTEFKTVVDDAIKATYASGQINQLYSKWFTESIPPKGINLNFPISADLSRLIANPHDRDQ